MKKFFKHIAFVVLAIALSSCLTSSRVTDTDPFIEGLLSKMSIEDKIGEMTQLSIDMLSVGNPYNLKEPHTLDSAKLHQVLVEHRVGSILNAGGHAYPREHWEHIIKTIQEYAINKKASGIPVLYGIDAIHGTNYTQNATLFPQQLGQASTWNLDLAKTCGEVTAYESRASGIPWTFSPVLDIGRDARWPRMWETYGEDVHLVSEFGKAYISGLQGDGVSNKYNVASCLKHFLGYSVTLRGRDRSQAWIPERQLREYFLPQFKAAMDAGALTLMVNSGEMNGIPVHANKKILVDLLRDELGFEGLAVTDWEDIGYLHSRHKIAKDYKEAIAIAINAGIDMAMVPMDTKFPVLLKELVEEGVVPMSRIDESVNRILYVKKQLGLFDQAYYDFNDYPLFSSPAHHSKALAAAEESIILAKNTDAILPLNKTQKLFITGPNATKLNVLNGGWTGTWQGADEKYDNPNKHTIYTALEKDNMLVANAAEADVLVVCLGEKPYTEKPGDLDDLDLDTSQVAIVKELKQYNKPIVLVVTEGRPRIIREIVPDCAAVVIAFLPGDHGGVAIANVLNGVVNPSGKLPITYPRYSNDLVTYDHKTTDLVHRDFSMNGFEPQFEFGHGLSYTNFAYSDFRLTPNANKIDVQVTVTNTGAIKGKEVVQLFVTDEVASITPAVKRLRAFDKIELAPMESEKINFTISIDDLRFVGIDNKWIFEPGDFTFRIADQKETISL